MFAKGHYYLYKKKNSFKHLIYPLPNSNGHGIHAGMDIDNNLRFGLMVSSVSNMQIDSVLLESDEYLDARFMGVAARKLQVSGKSVYLLNQENLKQRLLDMSQ